MSRIIGGMFGLEDLVFREDEAPAFLNQDALLLANARCGISILLECLAPERVWMPSYLCPTMLDAVHPWAGEIAFFEVDERLMIPSRAWLESVHEGDIVFLIDYFGFPCDASVAVEVRKRGAWVAEDASQALLSPGVGVDADAVLFSPRKFFGVPDGGILHLNTRARERLNPEEVALEAAPRAWAMSTLRAAVLRREFDRHGGGREWFALFQENESRVPIGHYRMSETTGMLLRHAIDYEAAAQRRTRNYQRLAGGLSELALYPELPAGVVPAGFPISLERRDAVRAALFEEEIYPPVHWQLDGVTPERYTGSHHLAARIMTLPCDQRYDTADIERIVRAVAACV